MALRRDRRAGAGRLGQGVMASSRVDPGTSVAYARRVLVDHAHATWRPGSREMGADDSFDDIQPDSSPMEAVDSRDLVVRLLADLPARQREVVVLRHYCGVPEKKIAATLGMSH